MELSVIIVNWNSAALLRRCLESVFAGSAGCDLEVLVLDNASYDGSAQMVSQDFPSVTFIQSDQNLGFAGGNNVAFQRARGRYVLFLNPDTEIIDDALQTMLAVMKEHKDAGVVGPKLVDPDLTTQIDCMRAFPTILNQMFDAALTRRALGRFNFAGVKPVFADCSQPVAVEMLPGTCMMLRREVFEQVGRFSERYFMYAEDVELNYRVKTAGLTNYYVGGASVVHHGGHSSGQKNENFFSAVMIREAVWEYLRATRGAWYASAYRATTAVAALARIAVLGGLRRVLFGSGVSTRLAQSSRKWMKVLRWCLGLECWAHGYKPAQSGERVVVA